MALIKPCPKCQHPLEIPQPPPAQIQCVNCGAIIKNKSRPAEAVTATPPVAPPNAEVAPPASPTPTAPDVSRPGTFLMLGMAVSMAVAVAMTLVAVMIAISERGRHPYAQDQRRTRQIEPSLRHKFSLANLNPQHRRQLRRPQVTRVLGVAGTLVPNSSHVAGGRSCGSPGRPPDSGDSGFCGRRTACDARRVL